MKLPRALPGFYLASISILVGWLLSAPLMPAAAQGNGGLTRYENPDLGITFDIPADWIALAENNRISAGSESDLNRIAGGLLPQNLVMLIRLGTYSSLGLDNLSQLPDKVKQLVLPGVAAPDPVEVTYGSASGYQTEFTVRESGLTTRVALLLSTDGRVAIVRGLAPQSLWANGASAQLTEIMHTIRFTLPMAMGMSPEAIPDADGGVLWHYQLGQFQQERRAVFGGMTLDPTGALFIAAGPRGFLALEQEDGAYINFFGPIFADDNLADVSLGPDARLYFANATTNPGRRVMVIDRAGTLQATWGSGGEQEGQFAPGMPRTIAVSKVGDVWTISEGHSTPPLNRVYRFNQNGDLLKMIDLDTIKPGLHNVHLDIDLLADRIYLVGEQGGINVVAWNGDVLGTGLAEEFLNEAVPTDLALNNNGLVAVSTLNQGFVLMNTAAVLLDRFGYRFDEARGGPFQAGEYLQPTGLALSAGGTLYFAETHPDTSFAQVQAVTFTGEGNLLIAQRVPGVTDVQTGAITYSTGGEMVYGNTVYGILNNRSNRHDYRFRAEAGDRVVITMQDISPGQTLDVMLFLYDASFNLLRDSDDVGPNTAGLNERDARIQFQFSRGGTYIIRATRFGGEGQYQLRLVRDSASPAGSR